MAMSICNWLDFHLQLLGVKTGTASYIYDLEILKLETICKPQNSLQDYYLE